MIVYKCTAEGIILDVEDVVIPDDGSRYRMKTKELDEHGNVILDRYIYPWWDVNHEEAQVHLRGHYDAGKNGIRVTISGINLPKLEAYFNLRTGGRIIDYAEKV